MSDDLEQRLRDRLADCVPDEPDAGDWPLAVRLRRAEQRRRTTGVAALALVLVLGGALLPPVVDAVRQGSASDVTAAGSGGQAPEAAPAEEAGTASSEAQGKRRGTDIDADSVVDCGALVPAKPSTLPTGATWARLCSAGEPEVALVAPSDALSTDVDGVVAAYNALPDSEPDQACTMELGPAYTLVVGYPDGTRQVVGGQVYGCQPVGAKNGADEVLSAFVQRLREQRAVAAPDDRPSVTDIGCDPLVRAGFVPTFAVDVDQVAACDPSSGRQVELSAARERVLLKDIHAHAQPVKEIGGCSADPDLLVIGVDAYGGRVTYTYACGRLSAEVFQGRGAQQTAYDWRPTGAAKRALDELSGR